MHFSCELLNQSVEHAARVVALDLLDKADKARKRLDDQDDAEALHDFRVAVRRLRSWLRALEPCLGDSVPKKAQRQLERAAHRTGDARDAEVHQQWLEAQRKSLDPRERHGQAWLMEQITDEKAKSDRRVANAAAPAFDRASKTLSRKLSSYRVDVEGDEDTPRSFAIEMADLIESHGAALSECLARIQSLKNAKEGHQARIAGKRLRYLVEVVADCVSDGEDLVNELGELQDTLGDWHDTGVFTAYIADLGDGKSARREAGLDPGLRELTKRLERRGRKAFKTVKNRWPEAGAFGHRVAAIVEELSSHGKATEIERKYLLARLPELPNDASMVEIEQGYIPGDRVEERLRRVQMAGDEKRYVRTFKSGKGLARTEFEDAVSKTFFNRMWPLTKGRRLKKRRYTVPDDTHSWEVDQFLDRDLVLAEVELQSADDEVELPSWLGSVVVRDVTGESEYSNASLASRKNGASSSR